MGDTAIKRDKTVNFSATAEEASIIREAASAAVRSGLYKSITDFLRTTVLMACGPDGYDKLHGIESPTVAHQQDAPTHGHGLPEKVVAKQPVTAPTGSPSPVARGIARSLLKKEEREDPVSEGSSLRSEQAQAPGHADPEPEPKLAGLDRVPPPLKVKFKLSTGESVTNIWMFANGCRIPTADMDRLLNTKTGVTAIRNAMIICWARSLRDNYVMRWCAVHKRVKSGWKDTPRADAAFRQAAEFAIREHIRRQMSPAQFIEACNEMRPKVLKFITADLIGSAIAARVESWLPPEEREGNKGLSVHEDTSGQSWHTPAGETPIPVLRTAADRDRFLKSVKVRV